MNLLSMTIGTLFVVLLGSKTVSSQETASECGRPVITADSTRASTSGEPHDADHGVWPWMAALHLNAPSQSHFCDGILIGHRHVLTAAHCLHGKLSSEIRVHLGSHFTNVRLPGEQVIEASQICLHKQFRIGQEMYDIGMIKLKEDASFSRTVQPACLPGNDEEIPDNSQLFTTGWGSVPHCSNCSRAKTLKQMTTHSIANSRCLDYFNKTADPTILCSTVQEVPSLFGDTGSPVVGFCAPNYWVVYGIVSDGPHQNDFEHLPLITTKVSRYMEEFIQPYLDATSRAQFRRLCGSGR